MNIQSWDNNAQYRHEQVLSGRDVSFDKILVPTFVKQIATEIQKHHGRTHALEVGCGTGILAYRLSHLDLSIIGIDPSNEEINIASEYNRHNSNNNFIVATIEDYALNCRYQYDLVLSNMVFHAIDNIEDAIKSVYALINPGGLFIFSIPHPCFWVRYHRFKFKNFYYHKQSHHAVPFTITNDKSPFPTKIPYYHRPISDYVNCLIASGFILERLLEPFPDEEIQQLYRTRWNEPHFIFLLARKLEDSR